jgi:hypothetical protein
VSILQSYRQFSRATDWTPLPRRLKFLVVVLGFVGIVAGHSLADLFADSPLILIPVGALSYWPVACALTWWLRKRHGCADSDNSGDEHSGTG